MKATATTQMNGLVYLRKVLNILAQLLYNSATRWLTKKLPGFTGNKIREPIQPNNIVKSVCLARPFYPQCRLPVPKKQLLLSGQIIYLAAMLRLTLISVTLTFLLSQSVSAGEGFDGTYSWPLKLKKQLSSGFGDIRPGRFHMGLDLRTNSEEGARVYAPEDGQVWRLKTAYTGYGKALYIKGKSGRIYVFGHLQKYNWDIGTYLRERQIESQRYFQDFYLEEGELPVKKGEFIARTGQTGAGAPHLHFEVRNPDNQPTNPLYYKVGFEDKAPPLFEAVWLTCLDDSSLYIGGQREIKFKPFYNKKLKRYIASDTVTVSGRFAIKAAIGDYVGKGSFILGPSHIRLLIDGRVYHEIEYDKIDFDENLYSILDRDPDPGKEEYKRVFNLYQKTGSRLSNYRTEMNGNGSFSDSLSGFHVAVIEASDAFGNSGRLEFVFYYQASTEILSPFNRAEFADSSITFMFKNDQGRFSFDSVAVALSGEDSGSDTMQVFLSPEIKIDDHGLTLYGSFNYTTEYKLMFYSDGQIGSVYYFSTDKMTPNGQSPIDSLSAAVVENGMLFSSRAVDAGINWLQAEIITNVGSERRFYRKTDDNRFSLFYHPDSNVNIIEAVITRGPVGFRPDTTFFPIHFVRAGGASEISLRPECRLSFTDGQLFDDALLYVRDTVIPDPVTGYYIHGPFMLGPETSSFADWADLQTAIPEGVAHPDKIGLYVFDDEKGWQWAGGEIDALTGVLHSPLGGAGVLAVIADTAGPVISELNIREKHRVKISYPSIRFQLVDELSGIEDDLNFKVTIQA
jgi:hypothetical protein